MTTRPRPLRLVYVVPDLETGGAERHLVTLLTSLDPARISPAVICIGAEGAMFPELARAGVPATALGRSKAQAVRALLGLVGELRRRRPDVVLVRGYSAEMLGRIAAVMAGVPHRIVWVHHCGDLERRGRVRRLADRLLDRTTDAYFGVAQAQMPYLVSDLGYRREKIRIIHNGVDPSRFPGRGDHSALSELGIDPSRPVIGIVASLIPLKDHRTLLLAARRIVDEVPDLVLLIVGDGPQYAEIVRSASALGLRDHVILTGVRSDLHRILPALTVFTLCSYSECFPMSLLEAMAAGRPAVCTDVGGVGEIVAESETGFLVPPRDPVTLADRLLTLLRDPALRERMGAAARTRVEQRFTLAESVERAAREVEAVAGRTSVRPAGPVELAVVLDLVSVGGVEMLLLDLFRHFDPDVVRPRLICLRESGSLADDFRASGFRVETLDRRGWFDPRTLPRLVRSLRVDHTDVVLVPHHHRASLALGRLAAKIARVPVNLVAAHDMDLVSCGGRVLPRWAVHTLALSDALVLLTRSQGDYLRAQEGVGRRPWDRVREVVIPNGITLPPCPDGSDRLRARAALGLGPDDFVVGVVARLSPQKAHDVLFDAVARCLPTVRNLRLVVIGDGERSMELQRLADSLGIASRTSFLGTRRDVPALLPGLDVACLSSVHEGVPIALIEAMAAGVPVVATDCGGVRDIVADGEQGFVVPVGDRDALADRLRLLAEDPETRARLGKGGRVRAEQEFGIERTARAYESLMSELVVDMRGRRC